MKNNTLEHRVLNHHLDLGNIHNFFESNGFIIVEFKDFTQGKTKVGSNQHVVVVLMINSDDAVIMNIKNDMFRVVNKNALVDNLNKAGLAQVLKNNQKWATLTWQKALQTKDGEMIAKAWEAKIHADSLV